MCFRFQVALVRGAPPVTRTRWHGGLQGQDWQILSESCGLASCREEEQREKKGGGWWVGWIHNGNSIWQLSCLGSEGMGMPS